MNNEYMTMDEIQNNIKDRNIYIYGAGLDGERFADHADGLNIIGFLDTFKKGTVKGYKCTQLSDYTYKNNDYIIIVSSVYFRTMEDNLLRLGLIAGENFTIFDRDYFFHENNSIKRINEWNRSHFTKHVNAKTRIMIPIDSAYHCSAVMTHAYFANYYAEKYDAQIDCYVAYEESSDNLSPVIKNMYESFGANIIDVKLGSEEQEEADNIFEKVWDSVESIADIRNIYIYNIHFGTTFLRDYFRYRLPHFNVRDDEVRDFIKERIARIVFWYHRFRDNDYKVVMMNAGCNSDGYIRDIALSRGVLSYVLYYNRDMWKLFPDFYMTKMCEYYPRFWNELKDDERKFGIEYAKLYCGCLMKKWEKEAAEKGDIVNEIIEKYNLNSDDRIKIMIAPHIFEEDQFQCGSQIFDDNYFSWLTHLGELSEKYDYAWFIKPHPAGRGKDPFIINKIVKRFNKIHILPTRLNPVQLKQIGIQFALTVNGTIGEEYPLVGITVINAGKNLHDKYHFNINPKNKHEYDDIIANLDRYICWKPDIDQLYQFIAIHRLYYDNEGLRRERFWNNKYIELDRGELKTAGINQWPGTWEYDIILDELNEDKHKELLNLVKKMDKKVRSMRYDYFYKKKYSEEDRQSILNDLLEKL